MNETIFLLTAVIDLGLVLFAYRNGKDWLYATIVINFMLISTFGAKLIPLFGFVTNAGNVFFASVYVATHLLTEHYGKKEGLKAAWIGFVSIVFFIVMSQFTLRTVGSPESAGVSAAIVTLFRNSPRIALASMFASLIGQYLNVTLYDALHRRSGKKQLWLRDTSSNVVGQLVDSLLFFSMAFYGLIPFGALIQIIFVGFFVKVLVGGLGTGVLYASYALRPDELASKRP